MNKEQINYLKDLCTKQNIYYKDPTTNKLSRVINVQLDFWDRDFISGESVAWLDNAYCVSL